ncbi:MAG: TRAP transporter small permease [Planctomycetota bacterium]|nr:TRAP transporter small permease [Planctomycetota bacterium]
MLSSVKNALERVLVSLISLMLVAMLLLAIWQVTSRYILQAPAIYTEETLRFVMIWMGLLGSAYAFGTDQHLKLVFLSERLSPRGQTVLSTVNGLIVMFFALVILLLGGVQMVRSGMRQISPILNVRMGYVFAILPICAVLIATLRGLGIYLLWKPPAPAERAETPA